MAKSGPFDKKYIRKFTRQKAKNDKNRQRWNTLDEVERGKFQVSYLYKPPVLKESLDDDAKVEKKKSKQMREKNKQPHDTSALDQNIHKVDTSF